MSLGMKVMISQPMRGKTEKQIRDEREDLIKKLEAKSYIVVDTIFAEEPPKDCDTAIYYLAKSIEAIGKVDAVVFMNGYASARGCMIEHDVCFQYNKEIIYENEI